MNKVIYIIHKKILFLSVCISLCYALNTPLELYPISSEDSTKILSNKIVVNKIPNSHGNGEHFCVYGIIEAPLNEVFKVISKEEDYPKFMPRFTDVDYHYTDNNHSFYTFHIGLPLKLDYQYRIKIKEFYGKENAWIGWEMVEWNENSIADTWGQWYFSPVKGNKNFTLIQYQTYIDPGYVPYGMRWIIDLLTRTSLPHIIENSKDYIEEK